MWGYLKLTLIIQGAVLENERCDIGVDGRRNHTWESREREIGFEDIIIVSDEVPPPKVNGKSHTLWTQAHEENALFIDGERSMFEDLYPLELNDCLQFT